MRVLVAGASGFIGARLVCVLRNRGHAVIEAQRRPAPGARDAVAIDFARGADALGESLRLDGVDAVVNAVGIFHERGSQAFQALHVDGPLALFNACVRAGVPRVIQISALGADEGAETRYHLSKAQADRRLRALPLDWTIVQPSLVFGPHGTSARLFTTLASLPLIPLPGRGDQRIQPIHIDDLVEGMAILLESAASIHRVVPFVGPEALTLREYLADLRAGMRLPRARFIPVPFPFVRMAARLGNRVGGALLTEDALRMLVRGNTAGGGPMREVLGREPLPPSRFIMPDEARSLRHEAQLCWLLPLLRWSVALVWIFTGIVSLGLYPVSASLELLARSGVPEALGPLFLYPAAALDLALGIGILAMRRRRLLWLAQIVLIAVYTLIITVRLPEFWLHPYGPLLKNLPMLAAIYLLYRFEDR
jgi:uncharacterized protein YbjT (DUF2867 family)